MDGWISCCCLTLYNPMNCSQPGSSVHGILQERILEWVAIPLFKGSFRPRDQTQISCTAGRFFTVWATREALPQYKRKSSQKIHNDDNNNRNNNNKKQQHWEISSSPVVRTPLPLQATQVWPLVRELLIRSHTSTAQPKFKEKKNLCECLLLLLLF